MLPKEHRLQKKKDFNLVFSKGKGFKGDFFAAKIVKNQLKKDRFGFVVSKKVSLKATVRNRVRRRMAEAVKKMLRERNTAVSHKDMVLIALPGSQEKSFTETEKAVSRLVKKI